MTDEEKAAADQAAATEAAAAQAAPLKTRAAPKADPSPKTVKGIVAKGRTVRAGGGPIQNDKKEVVGHDDGQDYGPGEEVELPEAQYRDAIKHGFIVDPDAKPVINTGPKIQVIDDGKA